MRKRIVLALCVFTLSLLLGSCSFKLTTIRPTLITNIEVESIDTGESVELVRDENEKTDWLMDDLALQMEQFYRSVSPCTEEDGHRYRAHYYMDDRLELAVFINSDGSVCENGRRYVQSAESSEPDRSVNLDRWEECFYTGEGK